MAVSAFVKTNVSGTLLWEDGTGTPLTLTLAFDRGDFALSGLNETLNERVAIERRGRYINSAYGNRVYPAFSLSCWVSAFQDSGVAPGNAITFLTRATGSAYAAAVSTLGAGAAVPFAFDQTYTLEGTDWGDSADHTFTLADCEVLDFAFSEAADGLSIAINGVVRGAITGDLDMTEIA